MVVILGLEVRGHVYTAANSTYRMPCSQSEISPDAGSITGEIATGRPDADTFATNSVSSPWTDPVAWNIVSPNLKCAFFYSREERLLLSAFNIFSSSSTRASSALT